MGFWKSLAKTTQRQLRKELKKQKKKSQPRYTCNSCKRYTKGYGGMCAFCGKTQLTQTTYQDKHMRNCQKCGLRKTTKTFCEYCRTFRIS